MGEVSVEFTTEELLVLSEETGLGPPAGLGTVPFDELGAELQNAYREHARRSLLARRVLLDETETVSVVDAVRDLIEVTALPGVLTVAAVESEGVVESRFYASVPDVSVEHVALATSIHRLTPFATRDLLARVLRFLDLRPAAEAPVSPFRVSAEALTGAGDALVAHDHSGAVRALAAGGAPTDSAEAFVEALKTRRASAKVTILHKPEPDRVEGGELTWIDTGLAGLWKTEPEPDDVATIDIRPATASAIARELLSFLPGPFADRPPPPTLQVLPDPDIS